MEIWSFNCPHPACSYRYEIEIENIKDSHVVTENCDGCTGIVSLEADAPLAAADDDVVAIQTRHEFESEKSEKVPFSCYGKSYSIEELTE